MTRDIEPPRPDARWPQGLPPLSTPLAFGPEGPPIYTVVAFRVRLPGPNGRGYRDYDYAGVRAGDGRWYLTGGETRQGVDWTTLTNNVRPVIQGPIRIMAERASVFP